jgi:hypothetical protein
VGGDNEVGFVLTEGSSRTTRNSPLPGGSI